jgi:hypothetical protein
MGTQVYMTTEYKNGDLSTKVDVFACGLVVIETLTGYAVCSPASGIQFTCFTSTILQILTTYKQERIGSPFAITNRCLESCRK